MKGHDYPDKLTLKQAAVLSGKSARTLRRWLQAGVLSDRRAPGDRTSPVVVDTAELRAHLATLSAPLAGQVSTRDNPGDAAGGDTAPLTRPPVTTPGDTPVVQALQGQVATLREQVTDLRAERDRLLNERAQRVRQLQDMAEAKAALERELAGRGVRGLLKGGLAAVFGR